MRFVSPMEKYISIIKKSPAPLEGEKQKHIKFITYVTGTPVTPLHP